MIRTVRPVVWAFDCEWVPDARFGRHLLALPPHTPEAEVFAAMWEAAGATPERPRPFLKAVASRVASVAAVERRLRPDGSVALRLCSLPRPAADDPDPQDRPPSEALDVLQPFFDGIARRRPQLVGFNSHNADLRVLLQRGVALGLSAPGLCARPDRPWEGPDYGHPHNDWNVDLLRILGGAGGSPRGSACPSLRDLALLAGLPAKSLDGRPCSGADVADLWLAGEHGAIRRYNETDAVTTYLLFLRVAHFAGCLSAEAYAEEEGRVEALLERHADRGDAHLGAYLNGWRVSRGWEERDAEPEAVAP